MKSFSENPILSKMSKKDDDLFGVLHNLETLLKTEKRKTSSPEKNRFVKKTKKSKGRLSKRSGNSPKGPRKLYSDSKKVSQPRTVTPQKYNSNKYDSSAEGSTLTLNQQNMLCIYFLRWIKRCTQKLEKKNNVHQNDFLFDPTNSVKSSNQDSQSNSVNSNRTSTNTHHQNHPKVSFAQKVQPRVHVSKPDDYIDDLLDDVYQLNLEDTSPLPTSNNKKVASIVEGDFNNPNSSDFHYDSYEISEKSLSLLPPHGEGEVTEFNPHKF
ncbi:hypothetical protein TRFO_22435 [Tritrichomonas foetus]|uniref:Uncharacterized protein n=1 Tax=Tritrichomonas foetus TaxID=1144522 RepID=A0A1J4KCI3_9EUKA|nr:hypothetical protein TRFO_22435 [Tritrichomonas foetus]|eukprot:OHT08923.1 hypothetical protein TRFO_22435 [Tritrichomonas foetus]